MDNVGISSYLTLKQFQKYPERWERKPLPSGKGVYYIPNEEEKERWFREEMLHRS